jgi:hypothetical protein
MRVLWSGEKDVLHNEARDKKKTIRRKGKRERNGVYA